MPSVTMKASSYIFFGGGGAQHCLLYKKLDKASFGKYNKSVKNCLIKMTDNNQNILITTAINM